MEVDAEALFRLLTAVRTMREYQKLITPGAPAAIRGEARRWETEVDQLLTVVRWDDLPELPDAHQGGAELPELPELPEVK